MANQVKSGDMVQNHEAATMMSNSMMKEFRGRATTHETRKSHKHGEHTKKEHHIRHPR